MRTALRLALALVVLVHAVIHLLGIGRSDAYLWVTAAGLVLAVAALLLARVRWWWAVAGAAAIVSQVAIVLSWSEAWAGTFANVALLLAAAYGYGAEGPHSLRAQFRRRAAEAVAGLQPPDGDVTEADLADLPGPLAAYLRRSGVIGRPRVGGLEARLHGRARATAAERWVPFTADLVESFGTPATRLFLLETTRHGAPVDVLHTFGEHVRMSGRVGGLLTAFDDAGPDLDRTEAVTLFNDMCLLAPGALLDAPVSWQQVDPRRVRGTFRHADQEVVADLVFDLDGDLVDFESDARMRMAPDAGSFMPTRWSTPVQQHATFGGRRLACRTDAVWHASAPEGRFAHLELVLDELAYDGQEPLEHEERAHRRTKEPAR